MPAAGTATIDFGAFPGKDVATVAVTGQAGIVSGSRADAWLAADATALHSEDEHVMLQGFVAVTVKRSSIVAATGFTITAAVHDSSKMWGTLACDWAWA
jgi:hypothetical protein